MVSYGGTQAAPGTQTKPRRGLIDHRYFLYVTLRANWRHREEVRKTRGRKEQGTRNGERERKAGGE